MAHHLQIDSRRRRMAFARRLFRAEFSIPAIALLVLAAVTTPHLTHASDERRFSLVRDTAALQDSISRYRNHVTNAYNPITDGWEPMMNSGYLAAVPVNPITGSSTVTNGPNAASGWTFDAFSGRLDACIIDGGSLEARLLRTRR